MTNDVITIALSEKERLMVHRNGTIYRFCDNRLRPVRIVIEPRKRGQQVYRYQRFWIGRKAYYLHRIVATAWVENPSNFDVVVHKDGNTLNNSSANLRWVYNAQESRRLHLNLTAQVYYQALDPTRLVGQQVWIYNYYQFGQEADIRAMFLEGKLKSVCHWSNSAKDDDLFSSAYDALYDYVLKNIRSGLVLPRPGAGHENGLFNYAVKSFSWIYMHRKREWQIAHRPGLCVSIQL